MGIVRFALRFPHTFYVLALLILFLGVTAIRSMPIDIFPEIDIPVVTVIWQYTGLSTPEMEPRVTTYSEYAISSNVNEIRDIEAQTLAGIFPDPVWREISPNHGRYRKDVGYVRDGYAVQQNIVHENGRRSVLLSVIKNGNASTLEVVKAVKGAVQIAREAAPPDLHITELFDQSIFVSKVVAAVVREGTIAAGLTALMILLFLGTWRSTLVVVISIPLAVLTSLIVLYFLGDTINTMTLGGLALAVGILVDDSTVTIENTHRLLTEEGKPLPEATLYGAAGIAVPTLVSTLAISCVFTSVIFLQGPAKYLFTPLGLAVVFAMLASYALSRTLTPITIGLLLQGETHDGKEGWFRHLHGRFERGFERMRSTYVALLHVLLTRRLIVPYAAAAVLTLGSIMFVVVGRDFFPAIGCRTHRPAVEPSAAKPPRPLQPEHTKPPGQRSPAKCSMHRSSVPNRAAKSKSPVIRPLPDRPDYATLTRDERPEHLVNLPWLDRDIRYIEENLS